MIVLRHRTDKMPGLKRVAVKVSYDLVAIFLVFLPWIVLHAVDKPFRRGFFCNDDSIKYPYSDNTVTNAALVVFGLLESVVLICILETVLHFTNKKGRRAPLSLTSSVSLPYAAVCVYRYYGGFLFGLAAQQTMVNVGKYTVGRLRPHFLSVCQLDFSTINCTSPEGLHLYVEDYSCNTNDQEKAIDSRLSFPSGHASFAWYCSVYMGMYVQYRLPSKSYRTMVHLFQGLMAYGAFYVALSRISDYKHHPMDVLAGSLVGSIVAVVVGLFVADLYILRGARSSSNIQEEGLEN